MPVVPLLTGEPGYAFRRLPEPRRPVGGEFHRPLITQKTRRGTLPATFSALFLLSALALPGSARQPDIVWMRGGHAFGGITAQYTADGQTILTIGQDDS